jgi:diguanylate cyclase (GGDEF)-like protein
MSTPETVRVLLAGLDRGLRDIAAATLGAAGFVVEAVASGDEALAACLHRMPDLLLLDVHMPEGDGYQACVNIRTLPGGRDVPIVLVTDLDDAASIDLAYDAGATDFVVKPINWPVLTQRIRYVLRGARTVEALRLSEQKSSALLRAIPDGILLLNASGHIEHCFAAIAVLPAPVAFDGAMPHLHELLPEATRTEATQCLEASLRGTPTAFEFSVQAEMTGHLECRFLPFGDGQVLAIVRDVTLRKRTEAHIHRLAYFDALTGLPNREWMSEYLARALSEAADRKCSVALLFVDLDHFKHTNDTLGHETGDALLREVAARFTAALAETGTAGQLARVGGDEFIVVLTGDPAVADAERAAQRIQEGLGAPFVQGGYEFVVTPSIGIALFPSHGLDAQTLLKNADLAMYEAKAAGRNQFRLYGSAVNARALKRLSLEMDLRRAFESEQLHVYYQPQYDTRSLRVAGAEALLRWFHPERGQIATGDFIAVAEETGLIGEIGRWTFERVCHDLHRWRATGLSVPSIAVNVSGRDFVRQDVLLRLSRVVEDAHLPGSLFELELTEAVLMQDVESGKRSLHALKEFGFGLAVDDFGTGYCSLNHLKRFPLDTLKVDRTFVNDITVDADDAAIVRAIIGLGHNLSLKLVAEGVETLEQLQFLRAEGCDLVQGFLMSRAIAAEEFSELIRTADPITAQAAAASCDVRRERR